MSSEVERIAQQDSFPDRAPGGLEDEQRRLGAEWCMMLAAALASEVGREVGERTADALAALDERLAKLWAAEREGEVAALRKQLTVQGAQIAALGAEVAALRKAAERPMQNTGVAEALLEMADAIRTLATRPPPVPRRRVRIVRNPLNEIEAAEIEPVEP